VRFHFAEIQGKWPGFRRFDIILQGQVATEGFEILAGAPFRTALVRERETTVESGPLELRFSSAPADFDPLIAGIEVERVE
jgi:hypothetical protein